MQTLKVTASPSGLINNITHFFTEQNAHIQEMLQNSRRSGANRVDVLVSEGDMVIIDDGHGVYDPERMISIGASDWKQSMLEEMPAGMGLFSCFQIANVIEIYSGDWKMVLDYESIKADNPVYFEDGLEVRTGTKIVLRFKNEVKRESYAYDIITKCRFMPYVLYLTVFNDKHITDHSHATHNRNITKENYNRIENANSMHSFASDTYCVMPYDETKSGEEKIDFEYGNIYIANVPENGGTVNRITAGNSSYDRNLAQVITQGISIPLHASLNIDKKHIVRIHCEPGVINPRLPDRNQWVENDNYTKFVALIKKTLCQYYVDKIKALKHTKLAEYKSYVLILNSIDEKSFLDLPFEQRPVIIHNYSGPKVYSVEQILESEIYLFLYDNIKENDLKDLISSLDLDLSQKILHLNSCPKYLDVDYSELDEDPLQNRLFTELEIHCKSDIPTFGTDRIAKIEYLEFLNEHTSVKFPVKPEAYSAVLTSFENPTIKVDNEWVDETSPVIWLHSYENISDLLNTRPKYSTLVRIAEDEYCTVDEIKDCLNLDFIEEMLESGYGLNNRIICTKGTPKLIYRSMERMFSAYIDLNKYKIGIGGPVLFNGPNEMDINSACIPFIFTSHKNEICMQYTCIPNEDERKNNYISAETVERMIKSVP
jgi:hypothetical protein